MIISFLSVAVLVTSSVYAYLPIVRTKLGVIQGLHKKSFNGRIFSSFEGVPYAEPPIGENRFKAPQSKKEWIGTWNATQTYICMQHLLNTVHGQEDCLYLNIYIPREKPTSDDNFNVFVFIHGGAFMVGNGHTLGPEYLMDRNLIYISLNYRLGPLGFLDTQDDTITANNGLRDQLMALKWINENIRSFGGNPNSVTLAGISAGAASAHFHYISPLSKGLFNRGISFSGSSLNPWVLQDASLDKATQLAGFVGCDAETNKEMVRCLRQRPAFQIVKSIHYFLDSFGKFPFAPFAPTVEKNIRDAFLPDHPETLLKSGEVNDAPWIFSLTKDEGIFPAIWVENNLEDVDANWSNFLPLYLAYNYTVSDGEKQGISALIRDQYLNGEKLSRENFPKFIEMTGHQLFKHGVEKAVRLQVAKSKYPLYFYLIAFEGDANPADVFSKSTNNYGVAHGIETIYMFRTPFLTTHSPEEVKMKDFLIDLAEHFSNSSTPHVSDWPPVENVESLKYLKIRTPEDTDVVTSNELSVTSLWNKLYDLKYKFGTRGRIVEEL